MSAPLDKPAASPMTMTQWLICAMAAIGFAFDIYELLMLPLIARPMLMELAGVTPGTQEFGMWVGRLIFVPALVGGVFGLLGGYLTDRLGRRRVLSGSILLYAVSAFASGFVTSIEVFLALRCVTFVGVCVEFVAAVAWLAELFPDRVQRERALGFTQAFSSAGGMLVAIAYTIAVRYAADLPALRLPEFLQNVLGTEIASPHAAWRYTLMSGLIPAIPLILIRPFLPESPEWQAKKKAGTLKRPSFAALFAPGLRRTTCITTIMFACSYGAAFGTLLQAPQIVPGFSEVQAEAEGKPKKERKKIEQTAVAHYAKAREAGGLAGRLLLAVLAVHIIGRRRLLRVFIVPGLLLMPLVFFIAAFDYNPVLFGPIRLFYVGVFIAGLLTVAQFSFWGNYLPRVYPLHLRGTGESFAANIGGRVLGTSFAWVTSALAVQTFMPGDSPESQWAFAAAFIALFVYLVGNLACFFLPEPPEEELEPEGEEAILSNH